MKKIVIVLLAVAVIVASVVISNMYFVNKQVQKIDWDNWGVPHITTPSEESALYAFGHAQMQAHECLILELYAKARGKGALYLGEEALQSDVLTHGLAIPARARQWYAALSNQQKVNVNAFVSGMNDFASVNPSSQCMDMHDVLPIMPTDPLSHLQHVIHIAFIGYEELGGAEDALSPGSNAYAIAPSRSSSNNAMLLANPHLPWFDLYLFFEAHIRFESVNVYGAALVGTPFIGIGFNESLGWTHTVNQFDGIDLYKIEKNDEGYLYDNEQLIFDEQPVTLQIKQDDGTVNDFTHIIKHSVHGPIITENEKHAVAMRIAGLESYGMLDQYWSMAKATNFEEFESAISKMQMPFFNTIYADKHGDIAYSYGGRLPKRNYGDWDFWKQLVPGNNSYYMWHDYYGYERLPKFKNPASGFIQNANDNPWTSSFPYAINSTDYLPYVAPTDGMGFRAQASLKMIAENESISLEELKTMKVTRKIEMAARLLDDILLAISEARSDEIFSAEYQLLAEWDGYVSDDSQAAVLFTHIIEALDDEGSLNYLSSWRTDEPFTSPDGLQNHAAVYRVFKSEVAKLKQQHNGEIPHYGELYRLIVGEHNLPANTSDGFFGAYPVTNFQWIDELGQYVAIAGDSYVSLVEFSDPIKAYGHLSYGNSSQIGSAHLGDQLSLFAEGKFRKQYFYPDEIAKNTVRTEILHYKP